MTMKRAILPIAPPMGNGAFAALAVTLVCHFAGWRLLQETDWSIQKQVLFYALLVALVLTVALRLSWQLSRNEAYLPAAGELHSRAYAAGLTLFIAVAISKLHLLVEENFGKALWILASVLQYAIAFFVGWLVYRLLVPFDARDTAQNSASNRGERA